MARDYEINYEKLISAYDEAVDQADAELISMGLHQADRPTNKAGEFADLPTMPEDISSLGYRELCTLLGKLTAWYGYALGRQADTQCRRDCSEEQRAAAWAKIRRLKDGTVADKDDAVRTDSRYVGVNAAVRRDESLLIKLRVIVESLKRAIETISRAIAAKDSTTNVEGRGASAARKQGSEAAREVFQTGHRSALDAFKRRRHG